MGGVGIAELIFLAIVVTVGITGIILVVKYEDKEEK